MQWKCILKETITYVYQDISSERASKDKQKASKPLHNNKAQSEMFHLWLVLFKLVKSIRSIHGGIYRNKKIITSTWGTWTPVCVATCLVKTLNLGLNVFAAGPPSVPNSLNLQHTAVKHWIVLFGLVATRYCLRRG